MQPAVCMACMRAGARHMPATAAMCVLGRHQRPLAGWALLWGPQTVLHSSSNKTLTIRTLRSYETSSRCEKASVLSLHRKESTTDAVTQFSIYNHSMESSNLKV